ncbi:PRC-barrel domain-containing protein [Dactylosporangium sp. CA-233914]|uniref:PRC-barrel domain-containing protein n=1 Tax=Dactylosporangium sp. CA-233914 TaxID=3239934 RepID=UPI003D8FE7BD
MLFSEATGRPVVATDVARRVGSVADLVVDPHARRVVALRLQHKVHGADTLLWHDLTAFGTDAVTVASASRIVPTPDSLERLAGAPGKLLRKRLLTADGDDLGTVDNAEFDNSTGEITSLIVGNTTVDGKRLQGCGTFAVVVAA